MNQLTTFLHARLSIALIAYALLLAIWGTYGYLRHKSLSGGFRSSYLLLIGLTAVQGLAGLLTLSTGGHPRPLHLVYGAFAILFLPGLYFYAGRGDDRPREAAFLAAACWIVLIAYGRGYSTGHV